MPVRMLSLFAALVLVATACSSSTVDLTAWDPDEPVLGYGMDGGECSSPCAFQIEVFTDGTVDFLAYNNVHFSEQIEAGPLLDAIASTSSNQLIVGSRDCGRERDGNAPTLQLGDSTIDTCYKELDSTNLIVQTASRLRSRIAQQVPLLGYDVVDELQDAATVEGIDTTTPASWPSAISPSSCTPFYAENPDATSFTVALAVEPTDEMCNIWIFAKNSDPFLCPIPRAWPGEIIVRDGALRCPGS